MIVKAAKNDVVDKKPDLSLNPSIAEIQMAYAFMAGAKKYGVFNYTKGHQARQLLAAAKRHINQILSGEDYDKDCSERIGIPVHHWGCVMACGGMYLHQEQLGTLTDDRFKND